MVRASGRHRLDLELVARALAPSRERAQALVASGLVEVDGERARSAAQPVSPGVALRVLGRDHPWASRAGVKLAAGLEAFGVSCADRVCLDAGASTGGFTDVLLSHGARLVYAVDVGRGQLAARLAGDPRVRVMDETNLRTLDSLPGPAPDLFTLDLAFISLRLVMPAVVRLASPAGADVMALFKPQFELGRESVGRGGVVRDGSLARAAASDFQAWVAGQYSTRARHEPVASPLRGTKGNQEWLIHFQLPPMAGGSEPA